MKTETIEKYLDNKYGNMSVVKKQDGYKLDDLFIYLNKTKELKWYVNVEWDLVCWFGKENYYNIIRDWFFKRYGKEIGYDE